jgi:hypothetical protein
VINDDASIWLLVVAIAAALVFVVTFAVLALDWKRAHRRGRRSYSA